MDTGPQAASFAPSRMAVLLFSDIVGSTDLKERLGTSGYVSLLDRHNRIFESEIAGIDQASIIKHTGDGYFASFARASDAARVALRFQSQMCVEAWGQSRLTTRVGIHIGEVMTVEQAGRPDVVGFSADLAARLMSLASGGQILLTRAAFDDARQFIRDSGDQYASPLKWLAHGAYLFKGADEPLDVYEVGIEGVSPLKRPPDSEKVKRVVPHDQEVMFGPNNPRPAVGSAIPRKPNWKLVKKLGEGGFGEVWLAEHEKLGDQRVFKFCFNAERLRSLKREYTLFRLLKEALGERPDIVRLYEYNLDEPPFFLESEYTNGGSLSEWAAGIGDIDKLPLEKRLEMLAQIADAVAAAHSVGILHKDLKPSNILIHVEKDGGIQPQLADFGIGLLADRSTLQKLNVTETGFTQITELSDGGSSRTGTRMYAPPESVTNQPFTTAGDVYALGVMMYQMAIGDLERPLGVGWERDIADDLLREDVAAAVDVDRGRRIATAAEIAQRLRTLEGRRAERAAARKAEEEARLARRRRVQMRIAMAAALFLGVLGIVMTYLWRDANRQRADALEQKKQAGEQKQKADEERDHAQSQGYYAAILGAAAVSDRGEFVNARRLLEQAPQTRRNWEWDYLKAQLDTSIGVLRGHGGGVILASLSSDATRVLTASADHTARIWDAASGKELVVLRGHTARLKSAIFNPDGTQVLATSDDDTVRIWDAVSGKQLGSLKPGFAPFATTFAAGQARALIMGEDFGLRVWDVRSGKSVAPLMGNPGAVIRAEFSPDGGRVVTSAADNEMRVWDAASGDELRRWPGDQHQSSMVFSPDGQRLVCTTFDGIARIHDLTSNERRMLLGEDIKVFGFAAFSPDSTKLVTVSYDSVRIWDAATGKETARLSGHKGAVLMAAFSRDGSRVVTASADDSARIWDAASGRQLALLRGHDAFVASAVFSPDGTRVLTASHDGTARVWDAASANQPAPLRDVMRPAMFAAVSSTVARAVTVSPDGWARLWDAATGKGVAILRETTSERALFADFSPDGSRVVSTCSDRTIRVWDATSGKLLARLRGAAAAFAAFSKDNTRIITTFEDHIVRVWDVATEKEIAVFQLPESEYLSVATFDTHAKRVAAANHEGGAHVWDLGSRKELATIRGHQASIRALAFSPDAKRILTGSQDHTARIWDDSGNELAVLQGHADDVDCAAFSPDGSRVATTAGGMMRLWDAASGKELLALRADADHIFSIAFSVDGSRVLSASSEGIITWDRVLRADRYRATGRPLVSLAVPADRIPRMIDLLRPATRRATGPSTRAARKG